MKVNLILHAVLLSECVKVCPSCEVLFVYAAAGCELLYDFGGYEASLAS